MCEHKQDNVQLQKVIAPNSIEWGSASKGTKHKIYYEDEQDGKDKVKAAQEIENEKDKLFASS